MTSRASTNARVTRTVTRTAWLDAYGLSPECPGSLWLGLELFEHRRVVGGCPLLEDSAVVIHHEDVEQLPDDRASVGLQGADRGLGELVDKGPLDPRLAGDGVALDDDDAAPDRPVVKSRAYRGEVVREAVEVRDETTRAVELEPGS